MAGSNSLGLQKLSIDFKPQAVLTSLSGAPLTSLKVCNPLGSEIKLLLSALQPFSCLRELDLLDINSKSSASLSSLTCFKGLSSLTRLTLDTCVRLLGGWWESQIFPAQLKHLKITASDKPCLLNISHLTCLTSLTLDSDGGIKQGSRLPAELPELVLANTPLPADLHSMFRGVQTLAMTPHEEQDSRLLAQLAGLPDLQQLSLSYYHMDHAAKHAHVWKLLSQLRKLSIDLQDPSADVPERDDLKIVLLGLGEAASLTSLQLLWDSEEPVLACFVSLVGLTNLQSLEVSEAHTDRRDLLHLERLSQLTELKLKFCDLDDGTAAAALGSLKQLHTLQLCECDGLTDAVVPLVAQQLSSLRDLGLELSSAVTEDSVPLLSRLTQLTRLSIPRLEDSSMRHLRRVLRCKVVSVWRAMVM